MIFNIFKALKMKTLLKLALLQYFIYILYIIDMYIYIYIYIYIKYMRKNSDFKFLILFCRRSAYYLYILNLRDTHER